jgi:hypothetical protein
MKSGRYASETGYGKTRKERDWDGLEFAAKPLRLKVIAVALQGGGIPRWRSSWPEIPSDLPKGFRRLEWKRPA